MTNQRLIILGTFSVLIVLLVGAMFRDGDPVAPEALAALFALLGGALAYAFTGKDQ